MTNGSTGEKIKEKVKETIGAGESGGEKIKEKVKETIGMGSGGEGGESRKGELGPGRLLKLKKRLQRQAQIVQRKRWKALVRL